MDDINKGKHEEMNFEKLWLAGLNIASSTSAFSVASTKYQAIKNQNTQISQLPRAETGGKSKETQAVYKQDNRVTFLLVFTLEHSVLLLQIGRFSIIVKISGLLRNTGTS